MADQGLINFIKRLRTEGATDAEIKQRLLQAEWNPSVIDEALAAKENHAPEKFVTENISVADPEEEKEDLSKPIKHGPQTNSEFFLSPKVIIGVALVIAATLFIFNQQSEKEKQHDIAVAYLCAVNKSVSSNQEAFSDPESLSIVEVSDMFTNIVDALYPIRIRYDLTEDELKKEIQELQSRMENPNFNQSVQASLQQKLAAGECS